MCGKQTERAVCSEQTHYLIPTYALKKSRALHCVRHLKTRIPVTTGVCFTHHDFMMYVMSVSLVLFRYNET